MPFRVGSEAERQPEPKPFSREWLQSPPTVPVRHIPAIPAWMPSERVLVALLVLLLVSLTSSFGNGGGSRAKSIAAPAATNEAAAAVVPTPEPSAKPASEAIQPTNASQPEPTATHLPDITIQQPATGSADGPILPTYRVISFYGHPTSDEMGILGEFPSDPEGLLEALRDQAARYEAADPTRPVKLAFEVIASVGQNWPAENDTYLMHTGAKYIQEYADFCEENGILLILDVQIGHSTVAAEIESIRRWLEEPFVHLALDPEFAMPDGVIPGDDIGGIDADDIAVAQDALGQIVDQFNLPPKLLIVHRFTEGMIRDEGKIEAVPDVQLVIDFDGYGEPSIKQELYRVFTGDRGVEFAGIKLFYKQDAPLMTPSDVVALDPSPSLVIYQ